MDIKDALVPSYPPAIAAKGCSQRVITFGRWPAQFSLRAICRRLRLTTPTDVPAERGRNGVVVFSCEMGVNRGNGETEDRCQFVDVVNAFVHPYLLMDAHTLAYVETSGEDA